MNWLSNIFRRRRVYSDLAEEMREHLEERTEQLMRDGMSRKEAERAARRAFGNITLLEERSREVWQWPALESMWTDVRYAVRQLRKSPGFTITVIFSLALGLGANITIFTVVNALLFLPPAVSDARHLVEVMQSDPKASGIEQHQPLSYPTYAVLRDHNHTLSGFAAFDGDPRPVSWSNAGEGQIVHGQLVSGNFFKVIGVAPVIGRSFEADEDRDGGQPVVVISHSFWQRRLGGDASVIGRVLMLNGTSYTIVGVAPASFTGILIGSQPDFWTPLAMTPALTHRAKILNSEGTFWLFGVGRVEQGISQKEAQADLSVLSRAIRPWRANGHALDASVFPVQLVPQPFRGYVTAFTGLLMAAVGLVLLIACANAANLVLARAITRRRELAVRSALGAGRFRILRQTITESLLLSMTGGAVGLVLAYRCIPIFLSLKPASLPLFFAMPLDWRVFSFAALLSICSGIVFGVVPVLRSSRSDLLRGLKEETQFAGPRRSWLRNAIVVAQITVCLTLLISTALCVRSLFNARSIDPGFDIHHVVAVELDPGSLGYTEAQGRQFYEQLLEKVRGLPGVSSASLANYLPLGTERSDDTVTVDGFTPSAGQDGFTVQNAQVAPGYFATMAIPVLGGRDFSPMETVSGARAVVINQAMAKRFWPKQNPVGQHFKDGKDTLEIVGVVKTGKYRSLGEDAQPFMYHPLGYSSMAQLVVRGDSDESTSLNAIRHVLRAINPKLVPMDMESLSQYMALPLFAAHTTGVLLAVFGLVALLLATVGLSGVISYSVSQRTNEIGLRMALGANRNSVLLQVLRQGMRLTVIGILIGLAVSFAATRVLAGVLYGIKPSDPFTYVTVSLFLGIVAVASCYFPARRAASIDPIRALRIE